jgi:hypothetical protein
LRSKKFVAQGFSNNDTPRTELDKNSLEFYSNNGLRWFKLDNGALTYYNSNGKRVSRFDVGSLNFYDDNGNINGTLRSGKNAALGINTGYPKRTLHVSDKGTMVQVRLQRTGGSNGTVDMGTANNNLYFFPGGYSNKNGNVIFDTTGKVGIGMTSPKYRLHVNGSMKATIVDTGDIVFHKDGQKLWRMFEDEKGLYLDHIKTKNVYTFVLQEVR